MDDTLREAARLLAEGRRLSGQLSYRRRAPASKAQPFFEQARDKLLALEQRNQYDLKTLTLLAEVEECLLHYDRARHYLERAAALLPRPDKKILKKLVQYGEAVREWHSLQLTPDELAALGAFLEKNLPQVPGELSLRRTEAWLNAHRPEIAQQVLAALRDRGAFSDLQVLENVAK